MIKVREDIKHLFTSERCVADFLRIDCDIVRQFKNRYTGRFQRDGRVFYIKAHHRIGWWEIINELFNLRKPNIGAKPEYLAIEKFEELGLRTMKIAACGQEGFIPAYQRSFLVTEEIAPVISLEDLVKDWKRQSPPLLFKNRLVRTLARIARTLHENGLNHRDFYICHFLLDTSQGLDKALTKKPEIYLIDLHRVQQRKKTPRRWIIKDLGGLYFSALDADLTKRDLFRFMKCYTAKPLKATLRDDLRFWRSVQKRGDRLYRKIFKQSPKLPL